MSHGSTQVASGNTAPKRGGPQQDTKEVIVLTGVVLFLGGLLTAAWLYNQPDGQMKATVNTIESADVSDIFKNATVTSQAQASTTPTTDVTIPTASVPDIIHADIYFEVGRKGLTDEGKAQLSAHAAMLKRHEDYGVLIQGYTDQQGSASYNKQLGMKRAEAVKAELMNAGIAEHRIKAVSLGEEGALCIDTSDTCRHMNRRVHLEVRKVGQEHMVLSPVPTTIETSDSSMDSPSTMEDDGSTTESVPPLTSGPASMLEPD